MSNPEERLFTVKKSYPQIWKKIIAEWLSGDAEDAFWLTYSANYLLKTAGVRWAIDPYSLFTRVGGGRQPDFKKDLVALQAIALTHRHTDHFDLNLIQALRKSAITWVIPEFLVEHVLNVVPLENNKIIIPRPGIPFWIENLKITPFKGLHIHGELGVPSIGYLLEFNGKRWLFPGDTRTYDFSQLSDFGKLDGVVAHLWLGKGEALKSIPSQTQAFCEFFSQFDAKQLIITHLCEYGREPDEMWDIHHFQMVKSIMQEQNPNLKIRAGLMGDRINL